MKATQLAAILKKLGDAHYQAADELIALTNDLPPLDESDFAEVVERTGGEEVQPSLADASTEFAPEGSLSVCPKHRVPYEQGQYGPYCKQRTDDPAWGKQKGDTMWCRITPKNAAEYLRIKAAA